MLQVSPLSNMEGDFSMRSEEFSEANLLDNIDFDDLFGVEYLHELPDLEMDPSLLPDLFNGYDEVVNDVVFEKQKKDDPRKEEIKINKKLESNSSSSSSCPTNNNRKNNDNNNDNSNNNNNNNQTKRKTKVDWTPELHRRFVQVVEQLGVDKAVPSRILELMGNHCLTRHNIASHLQKYRSHRKHLLARETEAMNRTSSMRGGKGGGGNMSTWYPPTMGYPPMTNMHHPSFRPLHVWGHPQARVPMPMWPKQLNVVPSTCPLTPTWAPNPSFWHLTQQRRVEVAQVPVQGIPSHTNTMFKPDQHGLLPQPPPQSGSHSSIDPHPSKESIDAAIGDVLAKPWQPLPIGLKPPSTDTVLVELQRQGIFKIPPSCA
ncbi:transcription activator GLK1-like [Amaranthus tricolor]|uniref:transcription activator GLK1-like n=1 Tax=Amaranthus tricolor TaxID=29722 RepID=UPI00258D177B|nr:transcription activator GLK1-like [Amaranthus tricolor]XP_057527993.1 transcription activator GLK1-like [Amaranthus tricolor]XP_057527994.1 transcription activator GLK1-like [Amaranthus tricolor]